MTPVDPTLEDISEHGFRAGPTPHRVANVLADHLLTLIESSDEHCHRLDTLESQARPFQEPSRHDLFLDYLGRARDAEKRVDDLVKRNDRLDLELGDVRTKLEAERDAAIARADEAERDLVEAVATTKTTATARDEYYRRFKSVEAERDAAREALRKIADPNIGLKYVRIIAKEALDGSGQHE